MTDEIRMWGIHTRDDSLFLNGNVGRSPEAERQLQSLSGTMRVNGHLRGYVNGFVDADIRGIVNGTVRASVDISKVEMVPEQPSGEHDTLAEERKESIPESAGEGDSNET